MAVYEFSKRIWNLPDVVAVTHALDRGINLIWTFVTKRDKGLRRRIYAQERWLMGEYPDLVFNFHVGALDQGASESTLRDQKSRTVMCRQPEL